MAFLSCPRMAAMLLIVVVTALSLPAVTAQSATQGPVCSVNTASGGLGPSGAEMFKAPPESNRRVWSNDALTSSLKMYADNADYMLVGIVDSGTSPDVKGYEYAIYFDLAKSRDKTIQNPFRLLYEPGLFTPVDAMRCYHRLPAGMVIDNVYARPLYLTVPSS